MTTHRRARQTTVGLALMLPLSVLLGCTSGDPDPTPTPTVTSPSPTQSPDPTPTASPTLDTQQQHIEEAKASYTTYISVSSEVEQAGMTDWQSKVMPLVSGELRDIVQNFYEQASEQGLRQVGEPKIASMNVVEYVEDPTGAGFEQVRMEVCLDNSEVDVVDPAGNSVLLEGYPDRLLHDVLMQRQNSGRWTVTRNTTLEGQTC